jgi:hypothetical protein
MAGNPLDMLMQLAQGGGQMSPQQMMMMKALQNKTAAMGPINSMKYPQRMDHSGSRRNKGNSDELAMPISAESDMYDNVDMRGAPGGQYYDEPRENMKMPDDRSVLDMIRSFMGRAEAAPVKKDATEPDGGNEEEDDTEAYSDQSRVNEEDNPDDEYQWEGTAEDGPSDRDIRYMRDNPTDGVLEDFEQFFGITPNVNWRSARSANTKRNNRYQNAAGNPEGLVYKKPQQKRGRKPKVQVEDEEE